MPSEYLLYMILPCFMAFFDKQYKNTRIKYYAIFILIALILIHIATNFIIDKSSAWKANGILCSLSFLFIALYHLTKNRMQIKK